MMVEEEVGVGRGSEHVKISDVKIFDVASSGRAAALPAASTTKSRQRQGQTADLQPTQDLHCACMSDRHRAFSKCLRAVAPMRAATDIRPANRGRH